MMYDPNTDYLKWHRQELLKEIRKRYAVVFIAGVGAGVFVWPLFFHYLWME